MKLKTVTWGRVKSANYQSQKAEVTIELGPGESIDDALQVARLLVDQALGDAPSKKDLEAAAVMVKKLQRVG